MIAHDRLIALHDRLSVLIQTDEALQARIPDVEKDLRAIHVMLAEARSEIVEIRAQLRSRKPKEAA